MSESLTSMGFFRIGVVTPELKVADVDGNCGLIRQACLQAIENDCRFLLFPEMALSGYTCADLFYQSTLLDSCQDALWQLAEFSSQHRLSLVVGAPIPVGGRLYNCAVVISCGAICGIVPKTYLPNTQEFYEERWFTSALERDCDFIHWRSRAIPFGEDLLFRPSTLPECQIGIEICEDAWVANPPSGFLSLGGANLLLNLSASPETLGKEDYRRALVQAQSARCLAAYVYASAGPGESSTDLVFSGHSLIAENGQILSETERFAFSTQISIADIDIERLNNERRRNNSFAARKGEAAFRVIPMETATLSDRRLRRSVAATPFVPQREEDRSQRCHEIFQIQTTGLSKRLRHAGCSSAVVGISGGLDSTLALLVTVKAFDKLGWDRKGILAVTMPGFGTTQRTRGNAERLAELLGVTLKVISIDAAVRQHFQDIDQPEDRHDITFENAQARERTQILMDIANQSGGLVVGTGDLSELALGWCTYNADHMSMYGVNAGVPKTLVRYLVEWCAEQEFSGETSTVLHDVCATPVSPELLPPKENGEIAQVTEDHVGPYRLHDFFLFNVVRCHFSPGKVYFLARKAFAKEYPDEEILRWLKNFYRRFFSQQFKRSCIPDGPKVGSVVLSPRGDWRMPSDACCDLWLRELDNLSAGEE